MSTNDDGGASLRTFLLREKNNRPTTTMTKRAETNECSYRAPHQAPSRQALWRCSMMVRADRPMRDFTVNMHGSHRLLRCIWLFALAKAVPGRATKASTTHWVSRGRARLPEYTYPVDSGDGKENFRNREKSLCPQTGRRRRVQTLARHLRMVLAHYFAQISRKTITKNYENPRKSRTELRR